MQISRVRYVDHPVPPKKLEIFFIPVVFAFFSCSTPWLAAFFRFFPLSAADATPLPFFPGLATLVSTAAIAAASASLRAARCELSAVKLRELSRPSRT
jgi:hypothetical protein